ncbi:excalibur calcium-binding domain-containing protein [Streptomyces sp. NPDC054956]
MFQRIGYRSGRGLAVAAVAGALALTLSGCEGGSTPKSSDKPGPLPSPSAPSASAPSSVPAMPSLIGKKSTEAESVLQPMVTKPVEARSAYSDVPLVAAHPQWVVCFQTPAAGSPLPPDTVVEISLVVPGTPCPEKAGATLHPSKAPSPAATPGKTKPGTGPGASSPTPAPGPKDVYYKSCAEAKAAGAAPIRRGQPGYGKHLDRDNDGIACDK